MTSRRFVRMNSFNSIHSKVNSLQTELACKVIRVLKSTLRESRYVPIYCLLYSHIRSLLALLNILIGCYNCCKCNIKRVQEGNRDVETRRGNDGQSPADSK